MDERTLLEKMELIVKKVLPEIIRKETSATSGNIVRTGSVKEVNTLTRTVDVQVNSTTEVLSSLKYVSNVSTPTPGMFCLILNPDPYLKGNNFVLIYN